MRGWRDESKSTWRYADRVKERNEAAIEVARLAKISTNTEAYRAAKKRLEQANKALPGNMR